MVGGKVVEVIHLKDDSIWVNCRDGREECAIYIMGDDNSWSVQPGDSLWWQGDYAYWTPYPKWEGDPGDIAIKRIGSSGVSKPQKEKWA